MKRVALILSIIFLSFLILSSFGPRPKAKPPVLIKGEAVIKYLNEINEARKDPYAYGKKYGIGKRGDVKIDKKEFPPAEQVQLDSVLCEYAEKRALEMATNSIVAHTKHPYINGIFVRESIAGSTGFDLTNHTFILIEDKDWENLGHRYHLLSPGKLIGIGIAKGKYAVYSCVVTY